MENKWNMANRMNVQEDLKLYALKELKPNFGKKGYWKHSIVCKIAFYGNLDMKSAWNFFTWNVLVAYECEMRDSREREAMSKTFKKLHDDIIPVSSYYGNGKLANGWTGD